MQQPLFIDNSSSVPSHGKRSAVCTPRVRVSDHVDVELIQNDEEFLGLGEIRCHGPRPMPTA